MLIVSSRESFLFSQAGGKEDSFLLLRKRCGNDFIPSAYDARPRALDEIFDNSMAWVLQEMVSVYA